MKKIFFIFSTITLLFASCSSENDYNDIAKSPSEQTQKVALSLVNLNEGNTMSTRAAVEPSVKKIVYAVFKSGTGIAAGDEPAILIDSTLVGATPVSNINLDLQPGKYIVAVYATSRRNTTIFAAINNKFKDSSIRIDDMTCPTEFYGTTNIEVALQSVKATVSLQRVVGKVEIVIKDLNTVAADITSVKPILRSYTINSNWLDIMPNVMKMTDINAAAFSVGFDDGVPFNNLAVNRNLFAAHNENNPISFYCLQTAVNFSTENFKYSIPSLFVYLASANPTPSNMVMITNKMLVYPNKITRYTGTLKGANSQGFNISVQDQWGSNTETVEVEKVL